jgi:hypothetical protein
MKRTARIVLALLALVLCAYVGLVLFGVAGCATSGSGTGNIHPTSEP